MKGLMRIGCVVGLLLITGSSVPLLAMDAKEAKPEAQIAKEKKEKAAAEQATARQRVIAKARKERMVIAAQKAAQKKAATVRVKTSTTSQSSSSASGGTASSAASRAVVPTPLAGQTIQGLDGDEDASTAQKDEKAVAKEPVKVEEQATITLKADDGSTAKVALNWLLQLPFMQGALFDDMHQREATDYTGKARLCDYSQGANKIKRVAGCPVCNAVAQALFKDIATKAQLDAMVYALRLVYAYTQAQKYTPRGIARAFVLKTYTAADLMALWGVATRLGFYPFATAIVMQLRSTLGDMPTEKVAQAAFVQKNGFIAQPLIDQMLFEHAYAVAKKDVNTKVPDLSKNILCMYSFFPMHMPLRASMDQLFELVKSNPKFDRLVQELPAGKVRIALVQSYLSSLITSPAQASNFITFYQMLPVGRGEKDPRSLAINAMSKKAMAAVQDKDFDKAAFAKAPEGYVKLLMRKAYSIKKIAPLDTFPIDGVVLVIDRAERSNDGTLALTRLGLTNVAWLREELYLIGETQDIDTLILRSNKLTSIPANLLDFSKGLIKLDLCGNDFTDIPEHLLDLCTQLEELDLSYNKLTNLPEHLLDFCKGLKKVVLTGNPWQKATRDALVKTLGARGITVEIDAPAAH